MTRIPGIDAYLTREGPEHSCDPHAPFNVQVTHRVQLSDGERYSAVGIAEGVVSATVWDDRTEDAPAVVKFLGPDADMRACHLADVRNAAMPPSNEDGPGGSCTVCGDFHGEPQ